MFASSEAPTGADLIVQMKISRTVKYELSCWKSTVWILADASVVNNKDLALGNEAWVSNVAPAEEQVCDGSETSAKCVEIWLSRRILQGQT